MFRRNVPFVLWCILAALLLLCTPLVSAPAQRSDEISLAISPKVLICPLGKTAWVKTLTRIPRHPDNRYRSVSWASVTGMSGAFTAQMEAEDAAVFERLIEVTPGDYLFTACVYRPRAIRFCVSQEVEVH